MNKIIDLEKHKNKFKKPTKGEKYLIRKVLLKYQDVHFSIGRQLGYVRYLGEFDENKTGEDAIKEILNREDLETVYKDLEKIIKNIREKLGEI